MASITVTGTVEQDPFEYDTQDGTIVNILPFVEAETECHFDALQREPHTAKVGDVVHVTGTIFPVNRVDDRTAIRTASIQVQGAV